MHGGKSYVMETKSPIRIAQIMGKLWAGGVESVVFNYYRKIDKEKFQFDFYYDEDSTVEPPKDLVELGARFIKVPAYQNVWKYMTTLHYYFKKNNYQIVHSHINTLSVIPLFVAKQCGVPIRIQHNHSVPGGPEFKRNALKNFLRLFSKTFSTHYFACSEKAGRWMFGNKTFAQGKVFVMKNAIDFSEYEIADYEKSQLKTKLNLQSSFVVGHVGRFTFAKNHEFLLEIFKNVLKLKPNAKLLLVGDGELRFKIEKKIRELGLTDKVIMVGKVTNPAKYYAIMDVLILPSIFEGLSMTTVEAQASKKNIVVSEAVPQEAVISNLCHYKSLNDSSASWAKATINCVKKKGYFFTIQKDDYDIKKASNLLERKYLKLLS